MSEVQAPYKTNDQPPKEILLTFDIADDADEVMHRLASNFEQVKALLEENRQLMRQFLQVKGVFHFGQPVGDDSVPTAIDGYAVVPTKRTVED
jgi:hypothetical protein